MEPTGLRGLRHPEPHVDGLIRLFERFAPADVPRLGLFYAADARFKDPFNDVTGLPQIERVYRHMFETLDAPRFGVRQAIGHGGDVMLTWDLDCGLRGRPMRIHGASHLHFDAAGRIALHRDYWDAAEELYAKLPWIGPLMRALQRRLAANRDDR